MHKQLQYRVILDSALKVTYCVYNIYRTVVAASISYVTRVKLLIFTLTENHAQGDEIGEVYKAEAGKVYEVEAEEVYEEEAEVGEGV